MCPSRTAGKTGSGTSALLAAQRSAARWSSTPLEGPAAGLLPAGVRLMGLRCMSALPDACGAAADRSPSSTEWTARAARACSAVVRPCSLTKHSCTHSPCRKKMHRCSTLHRGREKGELPTAGFFSGIPCCECCAQAGAESKMQRATQVARSSLRREHATANPARRSSS